MTEHKKSKALPAILCLTDACDRPETELFIGLKHAGFDVDVMCNPQGRNYNRLVDERMALIKTALPQFRNN